MYIKPQKTVNWSIYHIARVVVSQETLVKTTASKKIMKIWKAR